MRLLNPELENWNNFDPVGDCSVIDFWEADEMSATEGFALWGLVCIFLVPLLVAIAIFGDKQ